jgi:hypothetical protein
MKKTCAIAFMIVAVSVLAHSADSRTITRNLAAEGIQVLDLDTGIGDVEIRALDSIDEVRIEILLTPRRGGFFSSKRKAEQEVEAASLSAKTKGNRLALHIEPKADDDRRFEENWSIEVPSGFKVEINHGVGDLDIRGPIKGIEIDSGVGDILVEVAEGDITIDLGVGKAVVRAPAAAYASAEGAGGVGDAQLTILGEKISSGGFVSHVATWSGKGRDHIEVSVGVGDAVITLD